MGNRSEIALLVLLSLILAIGSASADSLSRGLGARPGTPDEQAYVNAVYAQVHQVQPNALSRARAQKEGQLSSADATTLTVTRPAAVDNSALPWFPPIGNQGYQNSCVGWAAGYYYDTYTQAMDEGIDVSAGDPAHACSPSFLYPLLNDGVDAGAYLDYAMATLDVTGCSSLSLKPYDVSDYSSWPSEAAWVDALSRRTKNVYRISGRTLDGLEAVKQLLANGRLAVVSIDIFDNLYTDYPRGTGVDSDVLCAPGGRLLGGHAVTLVGYDDAKTYRDQRDGLIHQGAFLIANSWGNTWGVANRSGASKGFFWIAYNALLEGRFIYDVLSTDDLPQYRPKVYALVGLDHPQRGDLNLRGGSGLPSAPNALTAPVLHYSGGLQLAVNSSQRIAVDLTDLSPALPGGRLADLFVSLDVSPRSSTAGVVASAEFLADPEGDGGYVTAGAIGLPTEVGYGATGYAFVPLFGDVNWDNWAYRDIEACFEAGIAGGYPDGSYQPEGAVTRDQMAVYISRALVGSGAGVPPGPASPTFADVPLDYWAYDCVEYAKAQSIVQGYADGYHPRETVDRAQMAVFLSRSIVTPKGDAGLAGYLPPSSPSFADVPADYWAYSYIEYCKAHGIASGYSDGYHPRQTVTRDQMAVFIARAFGLSA